MVDENIVQKIENDEFYSQFLTSTARSGLAKGLSISEQVKKLGEGIEILTKELQKCVLEKHEDLLLQASHATKLEDVLGAMNTHVQNLFANAERLKLQISGPYRALENHTRVLGRLHLASHILRQVNRIQQLSRRLGNTSDPVQKATILQELEQLAADPELTDIDAVRVELRNIRSQQQNVVKLATGSLNQGIANENTSQATTALQIFINLGNIKTSLQTLVDISLGECRESLKSAFETGGAISGNANKNKQGPGKANVTSTQGFRNRVWTDLEKAFSEEIFKQCKQIKFLQATVDAMHSYNLEENLATDYWARLGAIISEEIGDASSAVKQMLEEEYPKLLQCFHNMSQKLDYDKFTFNRSIFDKCENAYLSGSLSRLLEPTQSMFGADNASPSQDQIDSLTRVISSELSVALVESVLSEKTAKNVGKCIKMFAVKTEQQLSTGPDAAQVIGGAPNAGQQLNIHLANAMYHLKVQVQRMCSNMKGTLPENCVSVIADSVQNLDNLMSAILTPIAGSINATVETIVITIHLEPDWGKLQIPPNKHNVSCSPYMRELMDFLTRVYSTYLAPFDNKECLSTKCAEIVIRCIELLVRHSSILRPISQGGRLRLQSDYDHLEKALKIYCPYLSDLGRPYRLFRSMATLVAQSPQEILAGQAAGSSVPASTVLLLLFSYAGTDLTSPHQNTGWSLPKLSAWLDEHPSENDRLDLIAGALQKYVTYIRQKNTVSYDPVYPIMSELLDTATKNLNT